MRRNPFVELAALVLAVGGVCVAQETISPRVVDVDGLAMRALLIESDVNVPGRSIVVFEGG